MLIISGGQCCLESRLGNARSMSAQIIRIVFANIVARGRHERISHILCFVTRIPKSLVFNVIRLRYGVLKWFLMSLLTLRPYVNGHHSSTLYRLLDQVQLPRLSVPCLWLLSNSEITSQTIALVTGATGHQGGATVSEHLKSGVKVHALVRDTSGFH